NPRSSAGNAGVIQVLLFPGAVGEAGSLGRNRGRLTLFITLTVMNPISPRLLHHMGQLMSQQTSPARRRRGKLPGTEHHVVPHGVGMRVHLARRLLGSRAAMHAHPREVVAEALLHIVS